MIKNTLFRFISMRAPEHLEKKEVDLRFVKHPDPLHANNYFLTAITELRTNPKDRSSIPQQPIFLLGKAVRMLKTRLVKIFMLLLFGYHPTEQLLQLKN